MEDIKNEVVENVVEQSNITTVQIVEKIIQTDVKDIVFSGTKIHGESENVSKFMSAFSKFFAEIQNPKNTKINPFLKNKYAPLDVVLNALREPMSKHGLSFMQIPTVDGDQIKVDTLLMHESGVYMAIEGISMKPQKMTAQEIGGVITYIRRYVISAICSIASEEDDDGNEDSGKKSKVKEMNEEDLEKLTTTTLKAKITTLAKDKMSEKGKEKVTALIEESLGKGITVAKTTDDDKEKLIKLYSSLLEL